MRWFCPTLPPYEASWKSVSIDIWLNPYTTEGWLYVQCASVCTQQCVLLNLSTCSPVTASLFSSGTSLTPAPMSFFPYAAQLEYHFINFVSSSGLVVFLLKIPSKASAQAQYNHLRTTD